MEQRRLRLGDILDDYCPRERRVTNHAVVAMIEDDDSQARLLPPDEGSVHRPLIRAQLPRPEGFKIERQAPDFTIRQNNARGGFRGRGQSGGGSGSGNGNAGGGHRFGRGPHRGGGSGRGPNQGFGRNSGGGQQRQGGPRKRSR